MDAFEALKEKIQLTGKGEAYDGPPAPAPYRLVLEDGTEVWLTSTGETGRGGTRVRNLSVKEIVRP